MRLKVNLVPTEEVRSIARHEKKCRPFIFFSVAFLVAVSSSGDVVRLTSIFPYHADPRGGECDDRVRNGRADYAVAGLHGVRQTVLHSG